MSIFKITGKYLDQPMLVTKFSRAVPCALTLGAASCCAFDTYNAPKKEKKRTFIKDLCVFVGTLATSLIATRGINPIKMQGKTIWKGFKGLSEVENIKELQKRQTKYIDEFVGSSRVQGDTETILNKAKSKVLKWKEVKALQDNLGKSQSGREFLNKLIPEPENVTSKEIFGEISRLSLMGLVPVLGGISGGIVGDRLTEKKWQDKIPDKIKEGAYQYLANIFLCNVGAGAAIEIMEKMKVKSKASRAIGMLAGIIVTGVIGGSAVANYIGKNLIDPLIKSPQKAKDSSGIQRLYSDRTPELLDIGLHVDDLATVAVMSGLSWIEPALPILYSISGYRSGIGYRNGNVEKIHKY